MKPHGIMILALGLLFAADAFGQDALKKELAKFKGEWQLVSANIDGKDVPANKLNPRERSIYQGNQLIVKIGDKVVQRSKLTIDSATNPKTISRVVVEGIKKGTKFSGIYELDGDMLKECSVIGDKATPKEFKSGPGIRLFVFKRVKS